MLLLALLLQASDPATQADAWIRKEMATRRIPGMAVAVIQDGKLIFERAYGLANVEFNVPATPSTRFIIASTTKAWAATAIMKLVEQGKVRLNQPVGELVPGLAPSWQGVPVWRLMSHTSGLPDVMLSPNTGEMLSHDRDSALMLAGAKPLDFPVGAEWRYNQTNFTLLGMIVDRASGTPFMTFILDQIAKPLGLQSAIFGDQRAVIPGRASQYTRMDLSANGPPRMLDSVRATGMYQYDPWMQMAAGLNATAGDLARFGDAVRAGRVIKPALRDTMWTSVPLADGKIFRFGGTAGMGLGWLVDDDPAGKVATMTGGAASGLSVYVQRKLTVAVLTNLQGSGPDQLLEGVAKFFK
ncbi:MAG: serine hydrolase domain-containing protein [Gemmatimonadales bacterium]|nr:serine hydrolase domain-containing protein [Gemmatimonadales bacterium]